MRSGLGNGAHVQHGQRPKSISWLHQNVRPDFVCRLCLDFKRNPGGNPSADVGSILFTWTPWLTRQTLSRCCATLHHPIITPSFMCGILAQCFELHKPLYLYYRCCMWTPYCYSINMWWQIISTNMLGNNICDLAKQQGYVLFAHKTLT